MLVYIHVPFCRTRCQYCAFHSVALGRGVSPLQSEAVRDFVATLLRELDFRREELGPQNVSSIFFGGGTPSLLPPQILEVLLERVDRLFTLEKNAEITLEANPESLKSPEQIAACLKAGINRLSMGVQSLDDKFLHLLGRSHCVQDVYTAVNHTREAGVRNLSLDFMWALPGQRLHHWLNTLENAVRLHPEHISAYALTLEEGTRTARRVGNGELHMPEEKEQALMFTEGAALLEAAGFMQYEISNFSRTGFQCRHNLGYWEGADYLGCGPSATSTLNGRRWTNPADHALWAENVTDHVTGAEIEVLTPEVRALEMIMLGLRTARGMSLRAYRELAGYDFMKEHARLLKSLIENGYMHIPDGCIRLTRQGMLISNSIISSIFGEVEKYMAHRAKGTLEQFAFQNI